MLEQNRKQIASLLSQVFQTLPGAMLIDQYHVANFLESWLVQSADYLESRERQLASETAEKFKKLKAEYFSAVITREASVVPNKELIRLIPVISGLLSESPARERQVEKLAGFQKKLLHSSKVLEARRLKQKVSYPIELPIVSYREDIVSLLRSPRSRVVVISGETGCGKSTQIPKMCLEAGRGVLGRVGITQPRRIAAISIAARIAEELNEQIGQHAGFKIRFSDRTSPQTIVKVMTDGILLAETKSDPLLLEYDTIIIDEAHERSLNIDFLLGIGRRLLEQRPELKLIITSATIDTEKFSRAFGGARVVEVSGRLFPVEVEYDSPSKESGQERGVSAGIEKAESEGKSSSSSVSEKQVSRKKIKKESSSSLDYVERAVEAVDYLCRYKTHGDILIFMPTEQDIFETCRLLQARHSRLFTILPLFSRLSAWAQRRIYTVSGPKIVVATNVAETSLTIPGIKYVIDTGLARIARYQPGSRIKSLPVSPISRASADQRKGRCGRVREGLCFRLYSEENYLSREEFTPPEILRSDLTEVILRMIDLELGEPLDFPFIDKPSANSVRDGYETLLELGAIRRRNKESRLPKEPASLTSQRERQVGWELTSIGQLMARLPLDPRLSRMLIQAACEGCLPEVAVIAAALSLRDPRERPAGQSAQVEAAQSVFLDERSDFLTLLNIWNAFHGRAYHSAIKSDKQAEPSVNRASQVMSTADKKRFCEKYYLSYVRMKEWTYLYEEIISVIEEIKLEQLIKETLGWLPTDRHGAGRHRKWNRDDDWPVYFSEPEALAWTYPEKKLSEDVKRPLRRPHTDVSPALYSAIHRSILSGFISNIACLKEKKTYIGTRNRELTIWPGSALSSRSPEWLVFSEAIKTSRLFARIAGRIDPEWLEEVGRHLIKRSYYNPEWDRERGEVTVKVRSTIFGLEIASGRRVSYGRIAPAEAHRIFIMSALVNGELDDQPGFLKHNLALMQQIDNLEEKLRRRDLASGVDRVFRLYSERLPGIYDIRSLKKVIKNRGGDDRFLRFNKSELMNIHIEIDFDRDFPDNLEISGHQFKLAYRFAPGEEDDGVTVFVPEPLLPVIPACRLDWGIKGFRQELFAGLIKSLPRNYRKLFITLAEKIRLMIEELKADEEQVSLTRAVSDFARTRFRIDIPDRVWHEASANMPRFLKLRVAVIEPSSGRVIEASRDVEILRRKLLQRAETPSKVESPAWLQACQDWEKSGLTDWTFGDLPEKIPVGSSLVAYPGLSVTTAFSDERKDELKMGENLLTFSRAEKDKTEIGKFKKVAESKTSPSHAPEKLSLAIKLFPDRSEAEASHRQAVRQLLQQQFFKDINFVSRYLKIPAGYEKALSCFGGLEKVERDMLEKLKREVLEKNVRTQAEFNALKESVVQLLFEQGQLIFETVLRIIKLFNQIRLELISRSENSAKAKVEKLAPIRTRFSQSLDFLKKPASPLNYLRQIDDELNSLVPRDFLDIYPLARLAHIPRYLEALNVRLGRARLDPEKDRAKVEQIAPFIESYMRLEARLKNRVQPSEETITGKFCSSAVKRISLESQARERVRDGNNIFSAEPEEKTKIQALSELRWMIEEFKIAVFAPEMKTAFPVSAVRLARKIKEIDGSF